VQTEYKDIDLYISDGLKHIIIENKIYSNDQPCQVIRYINIIKEQYDLDTTEDIYVIYLTPQNKDKPSMHKIDSDKDGQKYISYLDDKSLEKCSKNLKKIKILNNYRVKYQKNDYHDILKWLVKSLEEVRNITNLSEAIKQYMKVVQKVNRKYKGNVMTLKEYMCKLNENDEEKMYQIMCEARSSLGEYLSIKLYSTIENIFGIRNFKENIIRKFTGYKEFTKDNCKTWLNKTGTKDNYKNFGFEIDLNNGNKFLLAFGENNIVYGKFKDKFGWKENIKTNRRAIYNNDSKANLFEMLRDIKKIYEDETAKS